GAQPDCRPDCGAHPRRRRSELALIARTAAAAAAATVLSLTLGAPAIGAPGTPSPGYEWHLPRGFPVPVGPADNPMSQANVALGRRPFFETRRSVTGQYSCASCHEPARAFTDGRAIARGATGGATQNNAMTLANVAYNVSFGWAKPQVRSLEAQMLEPLLNEHPVEMGMKGREAAVSAALSADASYREAF